MAIVLLDGDSYYPVFGFGLFVAIYLGDFALVAKAAEGLAKSAKGRRYKGSAHACGEVLERRSEAFTYFMQSSPSVQDGAEIALSTSTPRMLALPVPPMRKPLPSSRPKICCWQPDKPVGVAEESTLFLCCSQLAPQSGPNPPPATVGVQKNPLMAVAARSMLGEEKGSFIFLMFLFFEEVV